jgi:hypothetical protein
MDISTLHRVLSILGREIFSQWTADMKRLRPEASSPETGFKHFQEQVHAYGPGHASRTTEGELGVAPMAAAGGGENT